MLYMVTFTINIPPMLAIYTIHGSHQVVYNPPTWFINIYLESMHVPFLRVHVHLHPECIQTYSTSDISGIKFVLKVVLHIIIHQPEIRPFGDDCPY